MLVRAILKDKTRQKERPRVGEDKWQELRLAKLGNSKDSHGGINMLSRWNLPKGVLPPKP